MRGMYRCDMCGQYENPDGLACSQCQKVAAVRRKYKTNGQIGEYDGRNYITGEASSRPDPDQF